MTPTLRASYSLGRLQGPVVRPCGKALPVTLQCTLHSLLRQSCRVQAEQQAEYDALLRQLTASRKEVADKANVVGAT